MPNKIYEYEENNVIYEVEMLSDTSDNNYLRYQLKVLKIIRSSSIFKPLPINTIFNVSKIKNCCAGVWELTGT